MHITLLLAGLSIAILLLLAFVFFYKKHRVLKAEKKEIELPAPIGIHTMDTSVNLSCGNVQAIFMVFGTLLWILSVLLAAIALSEFKQPAISSAARSVADFITDGKKFIYLPWPFFITTIYLIYSRTKLTWNNALLIDDNPAQILYYDIKRVSGSLTFIYLKSAGRTWVFVPTTSQDNHKFPNKEILKREQAFNETQLTQLCANLAEAGATRKKFAFFNRLIAFGFLAFILSFAGALFAFL